jgi:hypothetical protein
MNHIYKKQLKYKGLYYSRLQTLNGFETNSSYFGFPSAFVALLEIMKIERTIPTL